MDEHVYSLPEAVFPTAAESTGNILTFSTIDVLDKVSSSPIQDSLLRWKCLQALQRVCETYDVLPTRYPNIGNLVVVEDGPAYCGGSADVWRGKVDGCPVAVKVIRRYSTVPIARARERFYQEVFIWGKLSHSNILPFLGVDTEVFPFAAVSTWMQYGNLTEYLVHFPDASRLRLLLDTSRGLEYMHSLDCIHGDLKSFNVLVDGNHSARLADFGSSSLLLASGPDTRVFPNPVGGNAFSVRWLAPELIHPEELGLVACFRSKESDIYALAMLMYEVFSGSLPFEGYRDEGVILQVTSGARPSRPRGSLDLGLTDDVWRMMRACWDNSARRWTTSRIILCLESSIAATVKVAGPDERIGSRSSSKEVFRNLNRLLRGWSAIPVGGRGKVV